MSRIFVSHSAKDGFQAVAICEWLKEEGWDDVYLDVDPDKGTHAGERWQRALYEHASDCAAVLFLVSRDWLTSEWCRRENELARKLNKQIFIVLIDDTTVNDLPPSLREAYQAVSLGAGEDHDVFYVRLPVTHERGQVTFSREGLRRLKNGLVQAGLAPRFFAWPPANEPDRAPYRGFDPLDGVDAGIFFGRDGPLVDVLDMLRGLREGANPRLLVLLGASGAGKSSFLRAGVLPRLARDARNFFVLPIVRPERAALSGGNGLAVALAKAAEKRGLTITRAQIRDAIKQGVDKTREILRALGSREEERPPTLIVAVDQAEELFRADGVDESGQFLSLLRDLVSQDDPSLAVIFSIRTDAYDALERAKPIQGLRQHTYPLQPMPLGAYQTVIEGPAKRSAEAGHKLEIEPALTQALLTEIEQGGAGDALPLLAFTLEQLYHEHAAAGKITKKDLDTFKGLKGAIDAAVARVFAEADKDRRIPDDRETRLKLLRRGLIPWLAGVDPESKGVRRHIARVAQIPAEARPLIDLFVEQRLLTRGKDEGTGEATIEPAHEALLRQWDRLQTWLTEDRELLVMMDAVKRAARDWRKHADGAAWLTHKGDRLKAVEQIEGRQDLAAGLEPVDRAYLTACRKAEAEARRGTRRMLGVVGVLALFVVGGAVGWLNQSYLKDIFHWIAVVRPYMEEQVRPYVLTAAAGRALKPGDSFRECSKDTFCPEMILVPAGEFVMGSPDAEDGRFSDESPQHKVAIASSFAVSKFDVTFDDWDACVSVGECPEIDDSTYGRETKPLINVTWKQAQNYVAWLSQMTGKPYRLLTEAEWEYVARAGSTSAYSWGDDIGVGRANCIGCGSKWDKVETSPVGSFPPNAFGLYDMAGNVWQWVQECNRRNYNHALADASEWTGGDCSEHIVRGGSWLAKPQFLRSAFRGEYPTYEHNSDLGFRVARSLAP
jgi:formylglycine-generating enzyme required for sulfatase activity